MLVNIPCIDCLGTSSFCSKWLFFPIEVAQEAVREKRSGDLDLNRTAVWTHWLRVVVVSKMFIVHVYDIVLRFIIDYGFWWFIMVYDGFWWFLIYDCFWWFLMVIVIVYVVLCRFHRISSLLTLGCELEPPRLGPTSSRVSSTMSIGNARCNRWQTSWCELHWSTSSQDCHHCHKIVIIVIIFINMDCYSIDFLELVSGMSICVAVIYSTVCYIFMWKSQTGSINLWPSCSLLAGSKLNHPIFRFASCFPSTIVFIISHIQCRL